MTEWIIIGAITVPFLIMSVFLLNGKGAFLIAGYNTMSPEKKATYDEKALCRAVGRLLLAITVSILLFPLAIRTGAIWLLWCATALVLALPIGCVIYFNTGNRYRTNIDLDSDASKAERKPMSRVKKVAIVIGIVLSVQMCVGIGIMFVQGERGPTIRIHSDGIQISAMYGLTVDFSNISDITLVEMSMQDIGIGTRTNGYGSGSPALKGNFSSSTHGSQLLFVYASSSPTIMIERVLGTDIFISFRDSETTRATYRDMTNALPPG